MRREGGSLKFSPSDLVVFLESEFASWMDRWAIDQDCQGPDSSTDLGRDAVPDEDDLQNLLFAKKGMQHELTFLEELKVQSSSVVEIDRDNQALNKTLAAMQEGVEHIYQAKLETTDFGGWADFLAKREGESALGSFYYEPSDTKLARSPRAYFIIQLCAYADMLEQLQGKRSPEFEIILGDGSKTRFKTDSFFYYYRDLRRSFEEFLAKFNPTSPQSPGLSREFGRWTTYAEKLLEDSDHLSVLANITQGQIKKFEEAGVLTASTLSESDIDRIPGMTAEVLERLKTQAKLQIASKGLAEPQYQVREIDPSSGRLGLSTLPPASPNDVFFDIEGFPLADGGLEYLLGIVHLDSGKSEFLDWWAHDPTQEKLAFESFIDWAHRKWSDDQTMHIYHYAAYETTAMRRLMGKYATREKEVDDLLRNKVFVDCYTVVRQGLIVGTPSYSLKDIEALYRPKRIGEINTASGSVVAYSEWLESGQNQSWEESTILADIREYNRVDCESLKELVEWLRGVQTKSGIKHDLDSAEDTEPKPDTRSDKLEVILAEKLLSAESLEAINDAEARGIQELLAWLLEFHWREARPVFWKMYDRHEMTEQELMEDLDCLGALERTSEPPQKDKKSWLYQFAFDADQYTKLEPGSRCYSAHDLQLKTELVSIDRELGMLEIKLGSTRPAPPDRLSLIPDEYFNSDAIASSIFRYVEAWSEGKNPSQAVDDLINKRRPRIKGLTGVRIIDREADLVPQTIDIVKRLDSSVLCIQGPPGCGKTYTSAAVIVALLQDGKRIGVTANGHKTIINLLDSISEQAESQGINDANLIKVGVSSEEEILKSGKVKHIGKSSDGLESSGSGPVVIGATSWMFCRPEWEGNLDYIFVDEAGQFSLANAVGVGMSAANLVLIGDQMQLAQPLQGNHPGESGKSALEYYLNGLATIPEDCGIFLDTTWRMHPDVNGFISEAIYENRVIAHPRTANQQVLHSGNAKLVTKSAGIIYLPVIHDGNSQCSMEEVETIKRVVDELLTSEVQDFDGSVRPLTLDDILIVAPYNMQVRRLTELLGHDAQVGTVDRFQGLEAHVVIVSMAASSLDESPRGAEFLLSPNRINVAISRAKSLAIVVSSPELLRPRCQTIKQMELVNLFCWLKDYAIAV